MRASDHAKRAIVLFAILGLFASPFLIGWGLWNFASPTTDLGRIAAIFLVLFIGIMEGTGAWALALFMLRDW